MNINILQRWTISASYYCCCSVHRNVGHPKWKWDYYLLWKCDRLWAYVMWLMTTTVKLTNTIEDFSGSTKWNYVLFVHKIRGPTEDKTQQPHDKVW